MHYSCFLEFYYKYNAPKEALDLVAHNYQHR